MDNYDAKCLQRVCHDVQVVCLVKKALCKYAKAAEGIEYIKYRDCFTVLQVLFPFWMHHDHIFDYLMKSDFQIY